MNNKSILVVRNDKLGDFMLAWPAFALLKQQYPETKITALVPSYTKPMAALCPWIDDVIIDETGNGIISDALGLSKILRKNNFDVSISLYSEMKTAFALWLAGIPQRFGPATKLAQLFLNIRLKQKRSRSQKAEYEYNLDLIKHYIKSSGDNPISLQTPPFLRFNTDEIHDLKNTYKKLHEIPGSAKIIIIHPGTGGSAINLSLEQYAAIAQNITKRSNAFFIITAGPGEIEITEKLSNLLTDIPHCTYHSTDGIVNFSKFISICDLFISGSTGPLHIAGALNVPTAAFYPAKRSATPLRWQTLNQEDRRLAISPLQHDDEYDMRTINTETSSGLILQLLGRTD